MKAIRFLLFMAFAVFYIQAATAQQTECKYPYAFFGIQGGGQAVLNGYNIGDVITGSAGIYVGGMWTPVFGTRLHINGWESKEGVKNWGTYDFEYGTATVDLMANLVSAINHRSNNAVDLYFIGGIGANKVWGSNYPDMDFASRVHNHVAPTGKLGLMMDVHFSRCVSLNVEVDAYRHGKHDNNYEVNMSKDWQLTGMLGLKFSFPGKSKKAKPAPLITEEPAPIIAEEPTPAPVIMEEAKPAPTVKAKEQMRKEIFYVIKSSNAEGENATRLQEAINWLNAHPTATASVDGYADRATGTPKLNATYAEQRALAVKDALIKAGISASRLTVKSYGDTVQPFTENSKNRCVIIVAEEK